MRWRRPLDIQRPPSTMKGARTRYALKNRCKYWRAKNTFWTARVSPTCLILLAHARESLSLFTPSQIPALPHFPLSLSYPLLFKVDNTQHCERYFRPVNSETRWLDQREAPRANRVNRFARWVRTGALLSTSLSCSPEGLSSRTL
jgi:hypothetical protein